MPPDKLEILIRDSNPLMKLHQAKWVKRCLLHFISRQSLSLTGRLVPCPGVTTTLWLQLCAFEPQLGKHGGESSKGEDV